MQEDTDGEAGGRYRSYHPLGPLSNKHRAAVPLAASPAGPYPMTATLRLPFQASVHEENTPRLSARLPGTWANAPGNGRRQGSCLLLCSPPASTPHAHAISTPCSAHFDRLPNSGDKNRGFHANSRVGHTVVSDAMSPVLQALVAYRSAPASRLSALSCKQRRAVREYGNGEKDKKSSPEGIDKRCS